MSVSSSASPQGPNGLENASNLAATLESIATIIGLVVGAIWVYYKFIKDRVYRPRFDINLKAGYSSSSGRKTLLCALAVKNIGTSKIRLIQRGTGLRLSTDESPSADFRQPNWTVQRVYPVFQEHEWIESNETIRHELAIGVPDRMENSLLLEARLVCQVRRGSNISVYSRAVVAPDSKW